MLLTDSATKFASFGLCVAILQTSGRCDAGDDPQVVALIHEHVSPRAIKTKVDDEGNERIHYLGLPNHISTLEILPYLGKLEYLKTLHVSYRELRDDDLQLLPSIPNLQELRMGNNHVTDAGLKHLEGMNELRYLTLHNMQIRGPGLAYLADSAKLEKLDLGGNPLDDRAIPYIVKNFKKLRRFDFVEANVTVDGFMKLAELHWLVTISYPNNMIERTGDRQVDRATKREILRKYIDEYKRAKRKAREAGEDVPPDRISPFGELE